MMQAINETPRQVRERSAGGNWYARRPDCARDMCRPIWLLCPGAWPMIFCCFASEIRNLALFWT